MRSVRRGEKSGHFVDAEKRWKWARNAFSCSRRRGPATNASLQLERGTYARLDSPERNKTGTTSQQSQSCAAHFFGDFVHGTESHEWNDSRPAALQGNGILDNQVPQTFTARPGHAGGKVDGFSRGAVGLEGQIIPVIVFYPVRDVRLTKGRGSAPPDNT